MTFIHIMQWMVCWNRHIYGQAFIIQYVGSSKGLFFSLLTATSRSSSLRTFTRPLNTLQAPLPLPHRSEAPNAATNASSLAVPWAGGGNDLIVTIRDRTLIMKISISYRKRPNEANTRDVNHAVGASRVSSSTYKIEKTRKGYQIISEDGSTTYNCSFINRNDMSIGICAYSSHICLSATRGFVLAWSESG